MEPFLVTSALSAALAQRLARRLCVHCREAVRADGGRDRGRRVDPRRALRRPIGNPVLYKAIGCSACSTTGYLGRKALLELLVVTEAIEHLIIEGGTAERIHSSPLSRAWSTLRQTGSARRSRVKRPSRKYCEWWHEPLRHDTGRMGPKAHPGAGGRRIRPRADVTPLFDEASAGGSSFTALVIGRAVASPEVTLGVLSQISQLPVADLVNNPPEPGPSAPPERRRSRLRSGRLPDRRGNGSWWRTPILPTSTICAPCRGSSAMRSCPCSATPWSSRRSRLPLSPEGRPTGRSRRATAPPYRDL